MLIPRTTGPLSYAAAFGEVRAAALAVREVGPAATAKPRLLDRVRDAIRARHYSRRTEKTYVAWIRRYIFFHGKRHPAEMRAPEITRFLTSLAVEGKVAASTQNQTLSALVFLHRWVLLPEVPWLDDLVYAKRPHHQPVVLTREEVRAVLGQIHGVPRLMALLLYGAGLRLLECTRLRVKDIDPGRNQIVVRAGKGNKDRLTMLPATIKADPLRLSTGSATSISATSRPAQAGSSCRGPSRGSTSTGGANGRGSGCFRPPASTWTDRPANVDAITYTNRSCSAR